MECLYQMMWIQKNCQEIFSYQLVMLFIFLQLIAHLDKNLYQELYAIYKMRLSQKRNEKWTQYKIQVEETILENVKNYAAVDR